MASLVKRLRSWTTGTRHGIDAKWQTNPDGDEAADYIEKLEAALRKIGLEQPSTCFGHCSRMARDAMKKEWYNGKRQ